MTCLADELHERGDLSAILAHECLVEPATRLSGAIGGTTHAHDTLRQLRVGRLGRLGRLGRRCYFVEELHLALGLADGAVGTLLHPADEALVAAGMAAWRHHPRGCISIVREADRARLRLQRRHVACLRAFRTLRALRALAALAALAHLAAAVRPAVSSPAARLRSLRQVTPIQLGLQEALPRGLLSQRARALLHCGARLLQGRGGPACRVCTEDGGEVGVPLRRPPPALWRALGHGRCGCQLSAQLLLLALPTRLDHLAVLGLHHSALFRRRRRLGLALVVGVPRRVLAEEELAQGAAEGRPSARRDHTEAVLAALAARIATAAPITGSELALRAAARPAGRRIVLWNRLQRMACCTSSIYRRRVHIH